MPKCVRIQGTYFEMQGVNVSPDFLDYYYYYCNYDYERE